MAENPFTQTSASASHPANTPTPPALDRAAIARSNPVIVGGAGWFWWIAGLSLINSFSIHSGSEISFVIGLGFTLIADTVFKEYRLVAFAIDALALATICGLGYFARRGYLWSFVTGIVLYALDALIYLFAQDWMPFGFHCLALFYLFRGAKALHGALKAARQPAAAIEPPVLTTDLTTPH